MPVVIGRFLAELPADRDAEAVDEQVGEEGKRHVTLHGKHRLDWGLAELLVVHVAVRIQLVLRLISIQHTDTATSKFSLRMRYGTMKRARPHAQTAYRNQKQKQHERNRREKILLLHKQGKQEGCQGKERKGKVP